MYGAGQMYGTGQMCTSGACVGVDPAVRAANIDEKLRKLLYPARRLVIFSACPPWPSAPLWCPIDH